MNKNYILTNWLWNNYYPENSETEVIILIKESNFTYFSIIGTYVEGVNRISIYGWVFSGKRVIHKGTGGRERMAFCGQCPGEVQSEKDVSVYSMVTSVSNTVLHIWKLERE